MQQLLAIFITVFLAELGDKTQLATLLFAADRTAPPFMVFLAAAGALVVATAVAVVLGTTAERYLTMLPLKAIAGVGFIAIGVWTLYGHFTTSA
ncbi:MAG: TMEM165/GDT1 family protein [Alphaproteobacteria bacterium]|nr:TMEM165/GDT1 family protein [Alphaproteobacteria bacterium]